MGTSCEHRWTESDLQENNFANIGSTGLVPETNWVHDSWRWIGKHWRWDAILSVGALGMMKLGEYGVATALLVVAGIAAVSKLSQWEGYKLLRRAGYVLVVAAFMLVSLVINKNRGSAPWSNFSAKQAAVIPPPGHSTHELRLAFIDSPLLTQARRDRIADDLDRFYHYLVDLGLNPPTEASGGFGGFETRAITIGTTHTGPKAQMSFDQFDPILISESELDNPRAASDAYADFAIQAMLPEIPEPQSHTNSKGVLTFTPTIGSPGW